MTILRKNDPITTEEIVKIGRRLEDIEHEIKQMTAKYCTETEFDIFSESIKQLHRDIVSVLGQRQLADKQKVGSVD